MRFAMTVLLCAWMMVGTAHAEQWDVSYSGDGRYSEGGANRDRKALALLERPGGGYVQVSWTEGNCGGAPACPRLSFLSANGDLVIGYGPATTNMETIAAAAIDSRDRIIIAGTSTLSTGARNFRVLRYNSSGDLDTSFAGDGNTEVDFFGLDDYATALAIDADDNVVVAGQVNRSATDTDFGVARLRGSDGGLDTTFNGSGKVVVAFDLGSTQRFDTPGAIAIAASGGRITVVGRAFDSAVSRFRVAMTRITRAGALDTSFCNTSCSVQGSYTSINNGRRIYYFGNNSAHNDAAAGVALLGNGDFYIVGETYSDNGSTRRAAIASFSAVGNYVRERLKDGLGDNASFRSVQVSDALGQRVLVAGDSGPSSNYLLLQAFTANLNEAAGYGNCLANSGFCFIGGTGLGDNGPDQAVSLNLDRQGRPLFAGTTVLGSGDFDTSLFARFTNASGPKPDLIFRNGFQ